MSKKKTRKSCSLEELQAALTEEEQAVFEDFKALLANQSVDQKALTGQFFGWVGPILDRIGGGQSGPVWGEFKKAWMPKKRDMELVPFSELASRLPYPLGYKLRELLLAEQRMEEGESEPQFAFELCAVMGVLVRLGALVCIQAYVEAGKNDSQLNHLVVTRLRAPSDGGWLDLSKQLGKALQGTDAPFAQMVRESLAKAPQVDKQIKDLASGSTKTGPALQELVSFRNKLLHGETINEAAILRARALLRVAVRGFAWLADYRLQVKHKGQTWSLNGAMPEPIEGDLDLPDEEPCLVKADDASVMLSLSPLLRFRSGEGEADIDVDFDELFFLNAGSLERLSYIGYRAANQVDGKTLGSYDAFKGFMAQIPTPPIPQEPRIDFSGLAEFHSRLFVGRQAVIEEVCGLVREAPTQFVLMKALAGMGKSAIFATILQAERNLDLEEPKRVPSAADGFVRAQDKWAFHFCMPTDGRNSPTVALRSLIAQICDHFEIKRDDWLSHDLDQLKDEKFPGLLLKASGLIQGHERLVVVIDALDEGIGAEKETVPSCIPAGDYPGVVFLLSYRVDENNENSRVEHQLRQIATDRITQLENANPLAGLTQGDVQAYLQRLVDVYGCAEAPVATQEAVWDASTQNSPKDQPKGADPFYLRFLSDGVQSGTIRPDRAETVPESLDQAFEEMWMGLPTDEDFLCHRVLLTLGIMREYGDDELFSALFNRERDAQHRLVPDDVAAVRVKAGKLLVYDGERYGLFHDRFRVFLVGEQKDPIAEALGMG